MTELAAATRSLVVEREMPHPPEKIWRALTQGPLIGRRVGTSGRRAGLKMKQVSAIIRKSHSSEPRRQIGRPLP